MKILVLLALLAWVGPARADKVTLEVTARVVEIPKGYVFCGVIAEWGVIRYEVVRVDKGDYIVKEIAVVVLCPADHRIGENHKLKLGPAKPGSYVDKLGGSLPRYRALVASPAS
jgi:hypothetical protein